MQEKKNPKIIVYNFPYLCTCDFHLALMDLKHKEKISVWDLCSFFKDMFLATFYVLHILLLWKYLIFWCVLHFIPISHLFSILFS